jgi:HK97 family phage prohead protease
VIGTIAGLALPFGVPCYVPPNDSPLSNRQEMFKHTAFDASIQRGGQELRIDHTERVPGQLALSADNHLRFRFRIFDTAVGRTLLKSVEDGEITGASISFREIRARFNAMKVEVVEEAELVEISLCRRGIPTWFDTRVWIEA